MSDTKKAIPLQFPIEISGTAVSSITMRRPKVKDRMLVSRAHGEKTDAEQELIFIANLCELTPAELEELDMADYAKVQETLVGFRNSGQPSS